MKRDDLIAAIASLCFGCLDHRPKSVTAEAGGVIGRVFRSDSAKAQFEGVAVSLKSGGKDTPEDKRVVAEVKTDAKGDYSFVKVTPGVYILSAKVIFPSDYEAPCPVASTGLSLFPDSNADGWSIRMIRTNAGLIQSISSEELPVVAGQLLRRDIDLKCKSGDD